MNIWAKWVPAKIETETGGYWRCLAKTVEEQMQCSTYIPSSITERIRVCWPAEDFSCIYCECGCSDVCEAPKEGE